jgi:hypothetical protein
MPVLIPSVDYAEEQIRKKSSGVDHVLEQIRKKSSGVDHG